MAAMQARLVPAVLALAATLAPAGVARAESAVSCHCYRDRTFDLERPAAADPYVLATTRSSLLSAAYGAPKADLVRSAMAGTAADDLWIAHWGAARTGRTAEALLEARQRQGSWSAVFRRLEAGEDVKAALGAAEAQAGWLLQDPARDALARLAVDDVLVSRLGADPAAVRAFRGEGASSEEAVLAAVVQRHLGVPALPLLRHVRAGGTTWGRMLHESGIAPKDLDRIVRSLVN
jgi:hypothetical protein